MINPLYKSNSYLSDQNLAKFCIPKKTTDPVYQLFCHLCQNAKMKGKTPPRTRNAMGQVLLGISGKQQVWIMGAG
jgi:hypothetical protein